ncbi:MAG TPA: glycosyltransferase family 39 protein [Pyrinomonadaceae bacterium]|nr:glycosyltransferase family 39 protein [Pyrinomonadaceae bacterium]
MRTRIEPSVPFWSTWRWWLPPAVITLALVLYFVDPFIGDWDGLDYTMLSLTGYPSSMALGRNLFIFSNHALFVIARGLFQLQPEHAYLLFKYAVVAQAPLAVIAVWVLARDLTHSLYTATTAALLVTFSPVFVLYGGQVMTDVPSVLILSVALIVHLRGIQQKSFWLIAVGAALMGLGVNLRETIGFFLPWLVLAPFVLGWKLQKREVFYVAASCVVFGLLAFGWFGYWFITDPHYRLAWDGWRESMREESARHPVALVNLKPYVLYFFISAPLVFITLPFAPFREWRAHRMSPMLLLWLVAFCANLLLFFNYSTTINWRYFLTGLPGLVPLGATWLLKTGEKRLGSTQRAFLASCAAIVVLAVIFFIYARPISFEFVQRRAMSKEYKHRLEHVPADAIMISGAQTVAVHYWATIDERNWKTIGTGGGWPGDKLNSTIDKHLAEGKRVFIDADPRWWLPCSWQRDEIPLIVGLEDHFSFRHVQDTIYEMRPLGDPTARDRPDLKRLLPENRPQDTKKCPPGRV